VPEVRRLAVLRGGGLGDLLVPEPAVSALRVAYPDAELVLLGAAHHRALVEGRPGPVDRLEPVPLVHRGGSATTPGRGTSRLRSAPRRSRCSSTPTSPTSPPLTRTWHRLARLVAVGLRDLWRSASWRGSGGTARSCSPTSASRR
jgi:hypothetical protein